jgi:hypothetical protein
LTLKDGAAPKLKNLNLSYNPLTVNVNQNPNSEAHRTEFVEYFCQVIEYSTALMHLNMSGMMLGQDALEIVPYIK